MAFERFEDKGIHVSAKHYCSILKDGRRITLSVGIPRELKITSLSATFYFDNQRCCIAIELHEELVRFAYRTLHIGNKCMFNVKKFLDFHKIKSRQFAIPATIEEIDGKRMIVFPVEVEVSDDN